MHVRALMLGAALALGAPALAQGMNARMLGGAAASSAETIVANLARSADHTTLVAAVRAAGLADTLNAAGPFTLFAPTNAAFAKLPAGTVETLLKPENRSQLAAILAYHAVAGQQLMAASLVEAAGRGGGSAQLTTVQGGALTGRTEGPNAVFLVDGRGNRANVVAADVVGSNGVIHVIDTVLLPPAQ